MKTLCIIALFLMSYLHVSGNDSIRALIITGGHGFDRPAFFEMFDSFSGFSYTEAVQPQGNILIEAGGTGKYDLLIFYDMYDSITEAQKQAYIDLLQQGKPVIFMHHALVSYQDWPEFKNIVGGRYIEADGGNEGSVYEHDVNIPIAIVDTGHPVTKGLKDFTVFDETYGKCEIRENVQPLLATGHPGSMPYVAWINPYGNSQVIYIQNGHGPDIFFDENYRKLLRQAIKWTVKAHQ